MLLQDPTTWYHLVVAIDTTQSTASNRVKIYINGEQLETNSDYPPQNADLTLGNQATVRLGLAGDDQGDEDPYDGYMAEVNYIDGQSYDPTYFGFTDGQTGIWMPKNMEERMAQKDFIQSSKIIPQLVIQPLVKIQVAIILILMYIIFL